MRGRTRHLVGIVLGFWLLLGGPTSSIAEEQRSTCPICRRAGNDAVHYPSKAGHTFVRGAANALFGWTEVIRQPALEAKAGGSVVTGMAKGVGEGVKRTLAGVGEVLTFWTPKIQNNYVHFANDCPVCMGRKQSEQPKH